MAEFKGMITVTKTFMTSMGTWLPDKVIQLITTVGTQHTMLETVISRMFRVNIFTPFSLAAILLSDDTAFLILYVWYVSLI